METTKTKGLRFNDGKLRYDLIPEFANRQYVSVLTYGANKYTTRDGEGNIIERGDDNWRKGMSWKSVMASLKRHIAAWERGEDYDYDKSCEGCQEGNCRLHSGLLHTAHMQCNSAFLTEFYKIHPQGDDRNHAYLKTPKIGLDIDGVICDWWNPWCEKYGMPIPERWKFSYSNKGIFENTTKEEMDDFYTQLPPMVKPADIPFEPCCYITSRGVSNELTEQWIEDMGFPTAKVYTVGLHQSKVQVAKEAGVEIFVDDSYDNFVELNSNGICCFLYDAPHNQRYDVGFKRIKSLRELL